jgi:exonuclease SbcD
MRIVHTADWHVGRVWKSLNRLDEMSAVLDHLAGFLERERIDLVLMAGDVFESGSPPAEAERLVFQFFKRAGQAGVQSVVIAGNHDSPVRLEAWGQLAELVGVHLIGKPRPADKGGVRVILTRSGETAVVAALPFAPVRTWVSALDLAGEDVTAKSRYAVMFRHAVVKLSASFRSDAINLLTAHTHVEGAVISESERRVHVGEEWAAAPGVLPAAAQYVALGHIHLPQRMTAAPAPTYYAGSPLQLDFAEVGQRKVFLFVEAHPGEPVHVEEIPYEGGKSLQDLTLTLEQIEQEREALRGAGWLRLTVPLAEPDPDLVRKVRARVPNALVIHAALPPKPELAAPRPAAGATPGELYRAYVERTHGEGPAPEIAEAFRNLYEEARGDGHATSPLAD